MPSGAGPATNDHAVVAGNEARRLWTWQLVRQGLSKHSRLHSVEEIAEATFGLHAARLPSPFSTVAARASMPEVALSLLSPAGRAGIMTVRCMRKTLHTLPLKLAAVAHSATLHFRERDALRAIVNADISARTILRTTDAILGLLQAGPLPHREIESRLTGPQTLVVSIRLALKLAWERGLLTYTNDSRAWNREKRTFALTSLAHPGLNMAMDRREATAALVHHYFERYGPASIRDVAWWSGLSRATVLKAMAESPRDVVAITTPWCDAATYMYLDQFETFQSTRPVERPPEVNLLAHEDVALKAYFESRRRYLGSLPSRFAFNQIGEVLPTVVVDGRVIGTWTWSKTTRAVSCALECGHSPPRQSQELKRGVRALTTLLRLGLISDNG